MHTRHSPANPVPVMDTGTSNKLVYRSAITAVVGTRDALDGVTFIHINLVTRLILVTRLAKRSVIDGVYRGHQRRQETTKVGKKGG